MEKYKIISIYVSIIRSMAGSDTLIILKDINNETGVLGPKR
jgi:hypothetical protein